MLPRLNKYDIFDEVFKDPFLIRNDQIMKTDVKENDGKYILDIDIPGYDKNDINIELEDGYITVTASINKDINEEKKNEKYIHRERFFGKCSRTYFAGENITEDDIKAKFNNGILTITFPKEKMLENNNKKIIEISD